MGDTTRRPTPRLVAGTTVAAGLPATVPMVPDGDDPHAAWHAEWRACHARMDGPAGATVNCLSELPEWHRAQGLEGLIATTPAAPPAGVLAQLRIIARWQGELSGLSAHERAAIENALATLERLAGGAPPPTA
jgi:hypothetical protein